MAWGVRILISTQAGAREVLLEREEAVVADAVKFSMVVPVWKSTSEFMFVSMAWGA